MNQQKIAVILAMVMTIVSSEQIYADNLADSLDLQEVVVTGTRSTTDVRHLPMTVTVVDRETLTADHQMSVLPTVMREVPGLFVTSRSMMGYGVSTGAAGGINLRGITGGAGPEKSRGIPKAKINIIFLERFFTKFSRNDILIA